MVQTRYAVNQYPIQILLSWVQAGEISIPEIQRPFVWSAAQVRDLMDSLYKGYPIGYLIAWRNPSVRLKSGESSAGKKILIDGQQRITALMAAVLGREVLNKRYRRTTIRIAFHPLEEVFEVTNPAIRRNPAWFPDISSVLAADARVFDIASEYITRNPEADQSLVFERIQNLRSIINNQVGLIELDSTLSIEEVTDIFIRINSKGTVLSQADFVMSKIAASEEYGGHRLRKLIDYFCHLAILPEDYHAITKNDPEFAQTEDFRRIAWLKDEKDDLYDPTYTDVLRVAFVSKFGRGRLRDLVALLSGRDFEKRTYEEAIAEESFATLREGVNDYVSRTNFTRFLMILRSAGLVDKSLIGSLNVVNYAYIVYLLLRNQGIPQGEIETLVRKAYVLNVLTERFAGNPEGTFDFDIRRIQEQGFHDYFAHLEEAQLGEAFWTVALPQKFSTPVVSSPFWRLFLAAQVKLGDLGFLSKAITVRDMVIHRGDRHHIYPRNYLKKLGYNRSMYNQIANYAMTQSEINIAIGDRPPEVYFNELVNGIQRGQPWIGAIDSMEELRENLRMNAVPLRLLENDIPSYEEFLEERRYLMAAKLRDYYESL